MHSHPPPAYFLCYAPVVHLQPASWDAKFNAEMRQRPDQKFAQLMLCDVKKVSSNHLDHVSKIVFSNPLSAKHWHDYIMYMMARMQIEKFPKRKEQIARLLQFALDFLGDRVEKEESYAVRLHLLKASLARYIYIHTQYVLYAYFVALYF